MLPQIDENDAKMLDKKLQSKILYEENIKSQGHTAKFYNEYVNNTLEIKTASAFLGFVHIAAICLWLK
jgi:hypothetical protein